MKWKKIVARNCYPLQWSAGINRIFEGLRFKNIFFRIKKVLLIKHNTPLSSFFLYNKDFMETNFGDYIKSINMEAEDALIEAEKDIEEYMKIKPGKCFDDIINIYKNYKQSYGIMVMGHYLVPIILKALEKNLGKEIFLKIEPYLFTPYKKITLIKEYEEVNKIKQIHLEGEKLKKEIEKLAKKFGFIHSEYKAKEWTADDYLDEILNIPSKEIVEKNDKNFLKKFHFDEYSKWLMSLIGRCVYIFDEAKSAVVRTSWALRKTLSHLGIDEKTVLNCTEKEFLKWLKNKTLPKHDLLKIRDKFYAILAFNNKLKEVSTKEDVENIIEQEEIKEFIQIKEGINLIKGQVAYRGIVKGRAKIIYLQEEEDKIHEGEILVASNTTPELIKAMWKASAFVTDEGGMLCHAAIIAREMKKPCIIGTKIATKVLKDGDLVEVDADKGVVKIIERKK